MSSTIDFTEENYESKVVEAFTKYERDVIAAAPLFELDGARLETIARTLPHNQATYAQKAVEVKAIMKWLENQKARLEAIHLKNYNRGSRALSATDQRILLGGEPNIIELNNLIIEAAQLLGKFDEITDAFRQMGWMCGNITKLRVAELGDIIL